MTEFCLTTIDFLGASLMIIPGRTPAETLIAMKPVVEGMGLDWRSQHRKLTGHPVLSKAMVKLTTPWEGNGQQMTAITLNRLSFWLATIDTNKIPKANSHTRERVISFQEKCADVLFDHFFGKITRPGKASDDPFDEMKLKWINTAIRTGGAKAGRQMWIKVGAVPLPAILAAERQRELPLPADLDETALKTIN